MKIWLIQTSEPIRGIDGDARRFRVGMLADALVDAGHDVLWWSSSFNHFSKTFRCLEHRTLCPRPGLKVRLLHGGFGYKRNVSVARLLNHRSVARSFASQCKAADPPNCILCCMPPIEIAAEAVRYARGRGIPVIVDVRDCWPDLYLGVLPRFLRPFGRLALAGEFRRVSVLLRDATALTSISGTFLEWALGKAGRGRRETDGIFPLGFNQPRFEEGELATEASVLRQRMGVTADQSLVLFAGSFGRSYDMVTVLKAAKLLEEEGMRSIHFALAGDGGNVSELKSMATGRRNVSFLGWLESRELAALSLIARIGLAPYRADATQSLPNKPFEYMAAGLPILSSLGGELAALIENERIGLHFEPGNPSSLARQVVALVTDTSGREAMAARARSLFARRFNETVIYPEMAAYLQRFAGK